jgi:hypothetical protein
MPLINRIEIANFMNRERREPWRADWIHQVFNLMGYSTAINMPNGLGKSTIAQAVLGILTHDRSLHALRANHFAPQSNGRFTHLRVEFLLPPADPAAADMIAQAGGGASGDPTVFGIYGNAGENNQFRLYTYPGRLEDCPVGARDGVHYRPMSNQDFLARLEKVPERFPSARDDTRASWRAYVATIFDMPAIEQQLAYQKNKGGEGSSGYFDVSVPGVKDYAEAVFYERLAPELLTDLMSGVEGHDDEVGIEDTIHIKVQGVIRARASTEKAKKALARTQELLDEFDWVQGAGRKVEEAQAALSAAQGNLAVHSAVLRRLTVDDPLPGLLRTPGPDAPELASSLVMQGDRWFVPDSMFERITGEKPNEINLRADRKGVSATQAERSQLIDFACNSFSAIPKRGPAGRLYALHAALALLAATESFPKLYTRESATEALQSAFEWAQEHADTNPARVQRRQLDAERADLAERHAMEKASHADLSEEQTRLLKEQQSVDAQQHAHAKMANSGLFTADELAQPAATGQTVTRELSTANDALEAHLRNVATVERDYREWQRFVEEHGEQERPEAILGELESACNAAQAAKDAAERTLGQARTMARQAANEEDRARTTHSQIEQTMSRLVRLRPQVDAFHTLFPGESPKGLGAAVRKALEDARNRKHSIEREREGMRATLSALREFTAAHPGESPGSWLQARQTEMDEVTAKRNAAAATVEELQKQLAELERGATIAPAAEFRDALHLAGDDAIALHDCVAGLGLQPERSKRVLSMFSALLFAPVLPDAQRAGEAAARLAERSVRIPVFAQPELAEFCRSASILYDDRVASTWLVGVRTRPVDCLLNPQLVAEEKASLTARIDAGQRELAAASARRNELSPSKPEARRAQSALDALERGHEDKDAHLERELTALLEQLPGLERRASEEALQCIRAMNEYIDLLKDSTLEGEQERLARAQEAYDACRKRRQDADAAVTASESAQGQCQQKLLEATAQRERRAPALRRVAKFIEVEGPAFMRNASQRSESLKKDQATAQARTRFEFELAEAFARAGEQRPQQIASRLAQIAPELQRLSGSIAAAEKRRSEIDERLPELISSALEIDAGARALRKQHRAMAEQDIPAHAICDDDIRNHALFTPSMAVRQAQSPKDLVSAWRSLSDAVESDDGQNLLSAFRSARDRRSAEIKAFHEAIDRVKANTHLPLDDQMRIGLEHSKTDLSALTQIVAATQANFEQSRLANEAAQEHLDDAWKNIGEWLSNFTLRLPSNFKAMQRAFRPQRNPTTGAIATAGFEIEATLANIQDVRRVLDGLVDDVDRREKARASMGDIEQSQSERESEKRNVRRQIRSKFYRSVLLEPKIKVCMPSISQRPLKLEKNIFSSGQGIAVTLLWIRKMADYVSERELSRETVGARQRRHMRDRRTQFVIIDGAFSHLSDKRLITDALDGVKDKQGVFQLIVTGHDPNYRNDYDYFPSYVAARVIGQGLSYAVNEHELLAPEAVGSHEGAIELASLHRHVGAT